MPRRLPLLPLTLVAVAGLFVLASTLTAQPPAAPPQPGGQPINPNTIKSGEKRNLEDYQNLTNELRKLAQRWKNSPNPEDRARAQIIEDALKRAEERGVKNLFEEIINGLDAKGDPSSSDLARLIQKDKELNKAIQEIIDILESDDALTKLRKEIESTEKLVKDIKQLKADQEDHNALNLRPNSDADKQARAQNDLARRTQDLANKVGGRKDDPKDPAKPENKENQAKTDPKGGEKPGESKPDNQQAKGEPKDPNGNPTDPKSPNGEQKPNPMGGMMPDAGDKPMPKTGEPMAGEPKPGEQKPTGDMPPMQGPSKPPEDMKGGAKPSDPNGGEPKPSGSPMSPMDSQQGNSKSNPSPGSPQNPNNNNAQQPKDPAEKNLKDAVPDQKGAEQDLKNNDKQNATKKEEKAIEKIDKALEELEKRLKQLREKEQAKKLDDLEQRIEAMLRKQRAVRAATKNINDGILARKGDGKPETADVQKAQVQGNIENELVTDANEALKLLKDEGSAVVFAGVLTEVRKDMESVRDRLNNGNVGEDTLYVEDQIIAQLEKMLEAVKKQKKNLQNPPSPPMDGGPTADEKKALIELVEQLKLLKELQLQVNERTKRFGDKLKDGQQATDPDLQNDVRKLGERQKTIQTMLHDLATKARQ
jgi:hypothetical protein